MSFGSVAAVNGIDLTVTREIVAVPRPEQRWQTSTIDVISALSRPTAVLSVYRMHASISRGLVSRSCNRIAQGSPSPDRPVHRKPVRAAEPVDGARSGRASPGIADLHGRQSARR
jgi:hypothetical protein